MKEREKIWLTPELVILVRSKPEEVVLTVCKGGDNIVSSESTNDDCLFESNELCNEISLS